MSVALLIALLLDARVGEPAWLWSGIGHPVVWFGRLIDALDRGLNRGALRRVRGVLAVLCMLAVVVPIPLAIAQLPNGWVLETVGAAILLAHRSLVDHVQAVATGLRISLAEGRRQVSMIVGRDPETLDEHGVARAAIESAAENFSDGVVAPAFWFAVGGLPGIVVYKLINTADSMIGHKTERYRQFGWAAARLDDVLNVVPARLTGFLIAVAGGRRRTAQIMWRDAGQHRSPNAGWPEAAMAASLDVALAGPRHYASGVVVDPYMNAEGRAEATAEDIDRAVHVLWVAWGFTCALALAIGVARWAAG